jgi:hypothetical protein
MLDVINQPLRVLALERLAQLVRMRDFDRHQLVECIGCNTHDLDTSLPLRR